MSTYTPYRSRGEGAARRAQIAKWIESFQPFVTAFAEVIDTLELGPAHQYPPPSAVRTGVSSSVRLTVRWLLKPTPLGVTADVNSKGYEIQVQGRERIITLTVNQAPSVPQFRNDLTIALHAAELLSAGDSPHVWAVK